MVLVLPGFDDVLAKAFLPTTALMKELLPTLDLPTIAISSRLDGGYWLISTAIFSKIGLFIL